MRIITGFFVFFIVSYYGLGYLADNPDLLGRKAGWLAIGGLLVALFFLVIPKINDFLYGRKRGWGDGKCGTCGGSGRAMYDLKTYGIYEECRTCKGSGSGPGGPGREDQEEE